LIRSSDGQIPNKISMPNHKSSAKWM